VVPDLLKGVRLVVLQQNSRGTRKMYEHLYSDGIEDTQSTELKHYSGATVTAKEIRELKRVYDQLCFFADKAPKLNRLSSIEMKLMDFQRLDGVRLSQDLSPNAALTATLKESVLEVENLKDEQKLLQNELRKIRSRPDQHIRPQDIGVAMKALGKRMSKREVHNMMWEIDEKIDGIIDWEEFELMFERNVKDMSGLEPANFYHMVQFMIYDSDCNGLVSIDETMNMLYARLGRAKMESTIAKLFGGENGEPIKEVGQQGGEINFERYLNVVVKEQRKCFGESELGKTIAKKKRKQKK